MSLNLLFKTTLWTFSYSFLFDGAAHWRDFLQAAVRSTLGQTGDIKIVKASKLEEMLVPEKGAHQNVLKDIITACKKTSPELLSSCNLVSLWCFCLYWLWATLCVMPGSKCSTNKSSGVGHSLGAACRRLYIPCRTEFVWWIHSHRFGSRGVYGRWKNFDLIHLLPFFF